LMDADERMEQIKHGLKAVLLPRVEGGRREHVSEQVSRFVDDFEPLVRGGLDEHRVASTVFDYGITPSEGHDPAFLENIDVDFEVEGGGIVLVVRYTIFGRILIDGQGIEAVVRLPIEYRIPASEWSQYGPQFAEVTISEVK